MPGRKGQPKAKLSALMFALMLEELQAGPTTAQAMADHTGLGVKTVRDTLALMHRRRLIHVAAWERDKAGRLSLRAFAFGDKTDVRQARKPRPQINADYRARQSRPSAANPFAGLGA